ncbi:hypothetical protein [Neisseria montereyensis]|uniref:Yip1 domain-containing protein n=1 Tax=Neisseria montereyensis TaxID=2973938 RepID=A0ABT2FAW5_9NEIS|nr:hypothetical protein [Neisseria montereyensis]MCS4533302.1 hypothetical protein [Neisseria montereyensis]
MLYQLLRDMLDLLRLRYKAPTEYRYTLIVYIAVLLLLGFVNAASMAPIFGQSTAAVVFAVLLTVLKYLILTRAMGGILHYYGAPKISWRGFILATEALTAPLLILFYIPALATAGLFWQIWVFWVQVIGLIKLSGRTGWQTLIGYFVYFIGTILVGGLLMGAFVGAGFFDLDTISQQAQTILEANP